MPFMKSTCIVRRSLKLRFVYIGQPMSILVGDKLYESSICLDKSHVVIEELKRVR